MRRTRQIGRWLLGSSSYGGKDAQQLSPSDVTGMLDVFSSTRRGVVPESGGGTTNFLRADGEWAAPGGGGGGDSITVNGASVTDADLDDATPAAPAGGLNVKWQTSGSGPANVSAYVDVSVLEPLLTLSNQVGPLTLAKGGHGRTLTVPLLADYTAIGASPTTSGDAAFGIRVHDPAHAGESIKGLVVAVPASTFTLTARVGILGANVGGSNGGIILRNTNGRAICISCRMQGTAGLTYAMYRFSSLTAFVGTGETSVQYVFAHWWRLTVDATNITLEVSQQPDLGWWTILVEPLATYLTAAGGSLQDVGIHANASGTSGRAAVTTIAESIVFS